MKLRLPSLKYAASLVGLFFAGVLACGDWGRVSAQDPLTSQQRRGKQIYLRGTSPSGKEILAYLGDSSLEIPGSAMACANCHGLDGQGKPEGGVIPSNLNWEALTKPYGVTHTDGRKHPPYTRRGLELAIKSGTDPAGNKLQNIMPRYQMSGEDLADLIVYLERLGTDRDPGISDARILIGTAIPSKGALGEMGQAIKAVDAAFFEELNSQGGIYSRHLEMKVAETGETAAAMRANMERLIKDEQIFAITGAFIAGAEREIVPLVAEQEVPLIGPFTLYPQTSLPLNRQVFYLFAGIDGQARALVEFAAKKPELKNSGLMVVYPASDINAGVFESIKDQSNKVGLSLPQAVEYAGGHLDATATINQCKSSKRDVVFFLGSSEEARSLMKEADRLGWYPWLLLPSSSGGGEVLAAPAGFDGRVFLSFPTSPADQSEEATKEFRALAEKYKLPTHHFAVQISAYAAAKVLVEGLKRAGQDLSREKLIQELEGLYEYQTGLLPAITYGPNRRIGANGARVVTIDLKEKRFLPVSGWIDVK